MKLALIGAVLVLAAGCKHDEASPPPAAIAPPSDGIELVSAGSEPRTQLAYHLTKGTKTELEIALDVELETKAAVSGSGSGSGSGSAGAADPGADQLGVLPTIVMQTEVIADDVLADGTTKLRYTVRGVTARERPGSTLPPAQLASQMQLLVGLTLVGTLGPRGVIGELHVDAAGKQLPPALDGQLASLTQTFQQVAMPLPAQPVGAGASWRYRKAINPNQLVMQATTTVQLTTVTGTTMTYETTSVLTGADQTVTQAGTAIRVARLAGKGSGRGVLDLTRIALAGDTTSELHCDMTADDATATMRMKLATRIGEPARAAADQGAHSAP